MPWAFRTAALALSFAFLCGRGEAQTSRRDAQNPAKNAAMVYLRAARSSPLDLEMAGNLKGQFQGAKAYLRRKDLQALPQVTFQVNGDVNFAEPATVRGVELEVLARKFAAEGEHATVMAVSRDWYRGFYPQGYREIHRPLLVLEVDGKPPSAWPKSREGMAMGPYVITHPNFAPAFKVLAHQDERQIPWAVVRLEFLDEKTAYDAISPRGDNAPDADVQAGFRIAQQNCLRCHANSDEHTKATISWSVLAIMAKQSPEQFSAYVRDPQSLAENAQMPANPGYDDATLEALLAYFRTFAPK